MKEPYVPPIIDDGNLGEPGVTPQALVVVAVFVAGVYGVVATIAGGVVGVAGGIALVNVP